MQVPTKSTGFLPYNLPKVIHWLTLSAFLLVPFLPAAYEPASRFIELLFRIDVANASMEAALARILLLSWISAFVLFQAPEPVARLFRDAFRSWASAAVAAVSAGLVLMFAVLLWKAGLNPFFFRSVGQGGPILPSIYREDGLLENLTAIGHLLGSVMLVIASVRLWRRAALPAALLLFLAGAVGFFGGEEISWGQRIFGWQAEGIFDEVNIQHETNLHNLISWGQLAHVFALAMAAVTALSVYAERVAGALPITDIGRFIPMAGIRVSLIAAAFVTALSGYSEVVEEIIAWLVFCYAIQQMRAASALEIQR